MKKLRICWGKWKSQWLEPVWPAVLWQVSARVYVRRGQPAGVGLGVESLCRRIYYLLKKRKPLLRYSSYTIIYDLLPAYSSLAFDILTLFMF